MEGSCQQGRRRAGTEEAGGRKGHKGTTRKRDPARAGRHERGGGPPAAPGGAKTKYITGIPHAKACGELHDTGTAQCRKCGKTFEAESGLPGRG